LAAVVIASFIFGMAGGIAGSWYVIKSPSLQRSLSSGSSSLLSQNVTLSEDSAIVDVVKKAGPAVVSIVISEDLNKLPGYGNAFNNDPFFNFFNDNGQSAPQPTGPNIQQVGAGSGFFISADGLIVTNRHVVDNQQASYTVLTQDGKKYDATVLTRDPVNDLAIVKVDVKNATFLQLADSSNLLVGQRVVAIGNSLGQYQNTVTSGIVSGVGRKITAGDQGSSEQLSGVIQTDAAINPGNSGGPLIDLAGEVVGMNTLIDQSGSNLGFAVPVNIIKSSVSQLKAFGKVSKPYVGVGFLTLDKVQQIIRQLPVADGAYISSVADGSPASAAGLKPGDIVTAINHEKLTAANEFDTVINRYTAGTQLLFTFLRAGQSMDTPVILGEFKDSTPTINLGK